MEVAVMAGDGAGGARRREHRRVLRRWRACRPAPGIWPRLSESSRAWLTDRVPSLTRTPPLVAGSVATASDCWPLFKMWGTRRAGSGVNQRARFCIGSCSPSGLRRKRSCGILAHGFARVWCQACRQDDVVAFSCKGRGFCPSCGGRRMAATAAHLVDHVIPDAAPVRQWVLSLPYRVRFVCAHDPAALAAVRRILVRAVSGYYERAAARLGKPRPRAGAVAFVQRFDSGLRLNVHFHVIWLDGVYSHEPGAAFASTLGDVSRCAGTWREYAGSSRSSG